MLFCFCRCCFELTRIKLLETRKRQDARPNKAHLPDTYSCTERQEPALYHNGFRQRKAAGFLPLRSKTMFHGNEYSNQGCLSNRNDLKSTISQTFRGRCRSVGSTTVSLQMTGALCLDVRLVTKQVPVTFVQVRTVRISSISELNAP